MRRSVRTPLWLAFAALCSFGSGCSCLNFGEPNTSTKGCGQGVSGGLDFGAWGKGECGLLGPSIACCFDIDRDVSRLAKHVVDQCGCDPVLACSSQCILGDASVCTLSDPPLGLDYLPCADCVTEGRLDPTCAGKAMEACRGDPDCEKLAHCMRGVAWPVSGGGGTGATSSLGGGSSDAGTD